MKGKDFATMIASFYVPFAVLFVVALFTHPIFVVAGVLAGFTGLSIFASVYFKDET